jgi:putative oxidoreductase
MTTHHFSAETSARARSATVSDSVAVRLARWWPIPLRLIVGLGFMIHADLKLARGPQLFAAALQGLGVPMPVHMAWLTIVGELFGGLAVLLGFYAPFAAIPLAIILIVAIVTVHWPFGFSSVKLLAVTATGPMFGPPGYETNLLYLACLAALAAGGSGPYAFDTFLKRRRRAGTSRDRST